MFPYKDENPTILTPFVTVGIIVITVLAWVVVQGSGYGVAMERSLCQLALIPGELTGRVPDGTVIAVGPTTRCVFAGRSR